MGNNSQRSHCLQKITLIQNNMAKNIQFIGLKINTESTNGEVFKSLSKETNDSKARIAFLKECLEQLSTHPKIEKNALKLVMLPQLFFRGKNGAYTLETLLGNGVPKTENPNGLLGELQKLWMDRKWENWVLDSGAMIGYSIGKDENEENQKEKDKKTSDDEDDKKEETASTSDSLEELLQKAQHNQSLNDAEKKDEEYEQANIGDSIETLLKKAIRNKEIDEKKQGKTEENEEEDHHEMNALKMLYDDDDDSSLPEIDIEEAFQFSIIIDGGFENLRKATQATTLIVTPYKSDVELPEESDDTLETTVDISGDSEDYLLDDTSAIDHWGFIEGSGEINKKQVKSFQKDKKKNPKNELKNKLRDRSEKGTLPIPATVSPIGVFEVNKVIIAQDTCFDSLYQTTKKTIVGITDRSLRINLKKLFPKITINLLKNVVKKGADIHIISSFGNKLYKHAMLSKTKGWVFNAISLGREKAAPEIYAVESSFLEKNKEVLVKKAEEVELEEIEIKNKDNIVVDDKTIQISQLFSVSKKDMDCSFYICSSVKI